MSFPKHPQGMTLPVHLALPWFHWEEAAGSVVSTALPSSCQLSEARRVQHDLQFHFAAPLHFFELPLTLCSKLPKKVRSDPVPGIEQRGCLSGWCQCFQRLVQLTRTFVLC